jgi:hypothetical protein
MGRVVDGIEHGKDRTARVADCKGSESARGPIPQPGAARAGRKSRRRTDMLHTLPEHHLVEDFSSSLPNEPVPWPASVPREQTVRDGGALVTGTYDSSISVFRGLTRGWTWPRSFAAAAAAGLDFGLELEFAHMVSRAQNGSGEPRATAGNWKAMHACLRGQHTPQSVSGRALTRDSWHWPGHWASLPRRWLCGQLPKLAGGRAELRRDP